MAYDTRNYQLLQVHYGKYETMCKDCYAQVTKSGKQAFKKLIGGKGSLTLVYTWNWKQQFQVNQPIQTRTELMSSAR